MKKKKRAPWELLGSKQLISLADDPGLPNQDGGKIASRANFRLSPLQYAPIRFNMRDRQASSPITDSSRAFCGRCTICVPKMPSASNEICRQYSAGLSRARLLHILKEIILDLA